MKNNRSFLTEAIRINLPSLGISGLLGMRREALPASLYVLQTRWWKFQDAVKENFKEIENPTYVNCEPCGADRVWKDGFAEEMVFFPISINGKIACMRFDKQQLAEYLCSPQYTIDLPLINAEYDRIVHEREERSGEPEEPRLKGVTLVNSDINKENLEPA